MERNPTQETSTVVDTNVILIDTRMLQRNMLDLEDEGLMPTWCPETIEKGHQARIPNPDRALADGDPLYTSFMDVFGDDILGNRLKSWNKHWNMYMTH